ncbi:MAG: Rrf2 family transcriptional regulator [Synergistes sp.]|nr:Rrf2 family transcriptional regulator [Synergistes sp.]
MQITSRFTIAVHIITAIDYFKGMYRVNSEFLAGSAGVNPVIVRTVIGMLREAGIVETRRGAGGAELKKPLDKITFYDIYMAVDSVNEEEGLFHFHEQPNPDCPVGRNIHKALGARLKAVQKTMEEEMKKVTVDDVVKETRRAIMEESAQTIESESNADIREEK